MLRLIVSLVGRDDGHVLVVQMKIGEVAQERFEHLIIRLHRFKTGQRDGVLHARVVRVEGDYVGNAHRFQFLERHRAVHRLAARAAVLAALVQERHDHVDALRLAANRADDALEILIVIVGGHGHLTAVHRVFDLVGGHVGDDVNVVAAYAAAKQALAFARAKPRTACRRPAGTIPACNPDLYTVQRRCFLSDRASA